MTPSPAALTETQAVVALAVMAAFADGDKHERERAEVRRIAERLGQAEAVHLPSLVQDVLMQRLGLQEVAAALRGGAARQLAYEMAVGVCDADGGQSDAERRFLAQARTALGLGDAAAAADRAAESLAAAPLAGGAPGWQAIDPGPAPGPANAATASVAAAGAPQRASRLADAEIERQILQAAILNGALELLPETLSTLAIIPLQMKLVYRIGEAHGYALDSGHVKDFLATVGVGLTSQYLEQAGRKLLGGLLGKAGGGLLGGLGRQAVSSGMSFASTYALGHVAWRYYRGGRTMSTQVLKEAFGQLTGDARALHGQYLPQMQAQARGLDAANVMQLVRGG
ncbi:TerB family tellurite resistance protein [Piscinibacter sakaiensis]|uniref:Co-chaperone DjlA N-terminal domain-containing protein n=1 Tax=Piscinibacter sakaiensis TaxID=1547922 RepID=A0A0K8P4T9_PISS1|nr:TerB family tellurite resistance protein [Piscinibacter sakaiensis]GAP37672.1 hypothetical protein ISF6_3617 [Piscinibacter sakaiensis]